MDLRQLRYFVEIAQLKSLTAASSRLYVAQSALSRQLKLLEEELGVALLVREARGVRLTDAGETLLARAQVLLGDAENLRAELRTAGAQPSGRLQIGAPPSLRSMLTAPFAAEFARQHPQVTLVFREGPSRRMRDLLANGEADVVVVSTQDDLASFGTRPLLSEPLCWVGPPEARLGIDKPVSVRQLATQPLILTSYPNSLRMLVDRALADQGLQVAPVAEADMVSLMLDLIRRGMGYTVLPYSAVDEPLRQRSVRAARIRGLSIAWVTAWSLERAHTLARRAAIEQVADLCRRKVKEGQWAFAELDPGG
jgi:LysR family transcriptional regulator, nitrogen assimilation regulatory protein